ncbi:CAAX protease self-immunity [Leptospira broomii serovar Hurstbridge str. 5399]|uniref:CAAX protease self-immunity n=1 Tax=Leptospira broomii serovar Hurstbridge str. 5399 TaxID=1049789 RepID=T0FEG1_9LEPT|nr:CPBP family intramembrane glutamic endopeptidase [Leptospira broomii]EQA46271.1 CAAX protease self-immunity [Leptospira broomii serovar Hurstbridge str. 5399]
MTIKPFDWKIFVILLIAATFGLLAIIPYSLALQAGVLKQTQLSMPLPVLVTIQIVAQVSIFGMIIAIGLFFANRTGLEIPILEAYFKGEPIRVKIRSILPISGILGIVASLLIALLDVYLFQPALKVELGDKASVLLNSGAATPAAWKGFLASFYGSIDEEILLRLCLMSFFVWCGRFLSKKRSKGKQSATVFWIANIVTALVFGLGHLPATSMILPLTPLVIVRAIVLNGLAGVAFGYLYFTRGLESAMLSHFACDLVLHVVLVL